MILCKEWAVGWDPTVRISLVHPARRKLLPAAFPPGHASSPLRNCHMRELHAGRQARWGRALLGALTVVFFFGLILAAAPQATAQDDQPAVKKDDGGGGG